MDPFEYPEKNPGPAPAADDGAARLRLPADRRSTCRTGPLDGPDEAIQGFLAALSRGDLAALSPLLDGQARESLRRQAEAQGTEALQVSLRRRLRSVCECRMERRLELPDGTAECRLRVFQLQPGGHIRSCCWLVQARRTGEAPWRVTSFEPLPGDEGTAIMPPPAGG